MSKDLKVRLAPRYTKSELDLIIRAAKFGGESGASFVRRSSLFGARNEIKKMEEFA